MFNPSSKFLEQNHLSNDDTVLLETTRLSYGVFSKFRNYAQLTQSEFFKNHRSLYAFAK